MRAQSVKYFSGRPAAFRLAMVRVIAGNAFGPQPFLDGCVLRFQRPQSFPDHFALRSVVASCNLSLYPLRHGKRQRDAKGLRFPHMPNSPDFPASDTIISYRPFMREHDSPAHRSGMARAEHGVPAAANNMGGQA